MVARPVAMGGGGAGEIQCAQPVGTDRRADRLDDAGGLILLLGVDLRGRGRDIDRGVRQRRHHAADGVRGDGREIALQIDHDLGLAAGVEDRHRLVNPVRAGGGGRRGSSPPRRRPPSPRPQSRLCRWQPRPGRSRPPRPAAARGRSSARPRYRAAACRADGWRPCGPESAPRYGIASFVSGPVRAAEIAGEAVKFGAFIRVARARANRYLNPAWGEARKVDSGSFPAAVFPA